MPMALLSQVDKNMDAASSRKLSTPVQASSLESVRPHSTTIHDGRRTPFLPALKDGASRPSFGEISNLKSAIHDFVFRVYPQVSWWLRARKKTPKKTVVVSAQHASRPA